jgi:chemotaxis protein CheX
MAPSSLITDTLVQNAIVTTFQRVAQMMLGVDAKLQGRFGEAVPRGGHELLGNVGFVGAVDGSVFLCLTDSFARFATAKILGLSVAEVEWQGPEVVHDAMGEITNMTAGGFKNQLCDIGYPCKLTLPTIVAGTNLQVGTIKGATRHIFHFDCAGHTLFADIQFKTG